MQLPSTLQLAISELVESLGLHKLLEARQELTKRYQKKSDPNAKFMTTELHRQSYVISRLPATYAALRKAFQAIQERGTFSIKSLLDLGAGPGTGMWAACEDFSGIEQITCLERDLALTKIGKQLSHYSENPYFQSAQWLEADLENISDLTPHDLVLLSYSIGELNPSGIESLIESCWSATNQLLLIIEPGTPVGFERIRFVRKKLIDLGAHLIAPCPHHLACPMTGGDWCHFAARVERSSIHRRLKEGSLGYEDEKFSYVAATKVPYELPSARILRHPEKHSGHVVLKLCTPSGVQFPIISKKMGEKYKQARKAEWGDSFVH